MLDENAFCLMAVAGCFADLCQSRTGFACGDFVIDDPFRVINAQNAPGATLFVEVHPPRLLQEGEWRAREFRHPSPRENPIRIQIEALLHGIIDARCIDAGLPRLHLHLRPVDAGFIVGEEAGKPGPARLPIEREMVACDRLNHRAHPEIQPAGRDQGSHAGIHERQARLAGGPGLQHGIIRRGVHTPRFMQGMLRTPFESRFALQLLDEVTMPVEPGNEAVDRCQGNGALDWRQARKLLALTIAALQGLVQGECSGRKRHGEA
jgi:hypothetical protein